MSRLGLRDAFMRYGAQLRNVQWSVSAWAPDGSLVVSLWEHHRRPGAPGALEFSGSVGRWRGPGNNEFRKNIAKVFEAQASVRLVIVRTDEPARVEAGEDASKVSKEFVPREDLVGRVVEWDGERYAVRFTRE